MNEAYKRDPNSKALINTDDNGLKYYKNVRNRLKKNNSLQNRVSMLEDTLAEVLKLLETQNVKTSQ